MAEVPVNATPPVVTVDVVTNGQTVFAFPFLATFQDDLKAIHYKLDGTRIELSPGADFSASGLGLENGGQITKLAANTVAGEKILIYRDILIERPNDYTRDLFAAQINAEQDRIFMILQEQNRDLTRSIKTDLGQPTLTLAANIPDGSTLMKVGEFLVPGPNAEDIQDAQGNAEAAIAARNLAEKWASNPEDMAVVVGKFSAFHWSEKSRKSAEASGAAAATHAFPTTRAALKALNTTTTKNAYLTEPGYEGNFVFRAGNFTTHVASDPNEAIYVKATDTAVNVGVWIRIFDGEITPRMFGAIGFLDGGVNDGPAINRMFDYVRALQASAGNRSNIGISVNLSGQWRTTISINATGFNGLWALNIRGGMIIGACPGKVVFDLTGSRGYSLSDVAVHGEQNSMPSVGFQRARSLEIGACDYNTWRDLSTTGWFQVAALMDYAGECTHDDHMTIFNYYRSGRVAVYQNENTVPVSSDYKTVVTGRQSFITKKVTNSGFHYLPIADAIPVTAVSNAASAVVTAPGHPFVVGDQVVIFTASHQISKDVGTVSATTANTFTYSVNTSAMGPIDIAHSLAVRVQGPPSVTIQGASQFRWDACYVVAYGAPQIYIPFTPTTRLMDQITLDVLFEGAGNSFNILFDPAGLACTIQGFEFKTYQSAAYAGLMGFPNTAGSLLTLVKPEIENVSQIFPATPLIWGVGRDKWAMSGADILYSSVALVDPTSMASFSGTIREITGGAIHQYSPKLVSARIMPSAAPAAAQGAIWFDPAVNKLKICEDGTNWRTVTTT